MTDETRDERAARYRQYDQMPSLTPISEVRELKAQTSVWSDGRSRRRDGRPALMLTSDGKRCVVDVYGTIVATEREPDDWFYNVDGGEWANLLDLAEAVKAADAELRG